MPFFNKTVLSISLLSCILTTTLADTFTCPPESEVQNIIETGEYMGALLDNHYGTLEGQFFETRLTNYWECNYAGPLMLQFSRGNIQMANDGNWAGSNSYAAACTGTSVGACPVTSP